MKKYIKGRNTHILIDNTHITASTNCSLYLNGVTADAAAKIDVGDGIWDDPYFLRYEWGATNESFITNRAAGLKSLFARILNNDGKCSILFQSDNDVILAGEAIITQMVVSSNNNEFATLSLSFEGTGPLAPAGAVDIYIPGSNDPRTRGKALMLGVKGVDSHYHTFAAATNHTITINLQTSDVSTKDDSAAFPQKEVTGKSISVTTDNLLCVKTDVGESCITMNDLFEYLTTGKTITIGFGYYDNTDIAIGPDADWGTPSSLLLYGDFLTSSLTVNAPNKENATYSAEFSGKGTPHIE